MGLAASMIEHGIAKGVLQGEGNSACLVVHAAYVFLQENGLYPETRWESVYNDDGDYVDEEPVTVFVPFDEWHMDGSTEELWDAIPAEVRQTIHAVITELYPEYTNDSVWTFNDHNDITEDDILRVGKMVDERLNL